MYYYTGYDGFPVGSAAKLFAYIRTDNQALHSFGNAENQDKSKNDGCPGGYIPVVGDHQSGNGTHNSYKDGKEDDRSEIIGKQVGC